VCERLSVTVFLVKQELEVIVEVLSVTLLLVVIIKITK
jgi:hypothetical protein